MARRRQAERSPDAEALEQRFRKLQEALRELEASFDATLDAVASAIDLRSWETPGHSRRVTAYTLELAAAVGITSPVVLGQIRRGALLHDIGKLGIPDAVLHKTGPLNEREWRLMRRHPELGYQILSGIPFLQEAATIVLHHHEHWDGTGYPYGLKGEQIPLAARLFAVADALDAITSDRPYRSALSFEEARRRVARGAGHQFDPEVVRAFLRVPVERWQAIRDGASPSNAPVPTARNPLGRGQGARDVPWKGTLELPCDSDGLDSRLTQYQLDDTPPQQERRHRTPCGQGGAGGPPGRARR